MSITSGEQLLAWNLYQARTDSEVDWEVLQRLRARVPLVADRERCELLLRAVNGDALLFKDWCRLVGARLSPPIVPQGLNLEDVPVPLYEDARPALRAALHRIVRDPVSAGEEIHGNVAEILKGSILTLPALVRSGRRWLWRERVVAETLGPALIYALTLFLDPGLEYGGLLRQCSLAECGRFEIGRPHAKRGQPRNFYCTPEHQRTHARLQSKERVAAHRAGKPVDEWRETRTRTARHK